MDAHEHCINLLEALRNLDYLIIEHASDAAARAKLEEKRNELREELHSLRPRAS
jgi:hypothetical protein